MPKRKDYVCQRDTEKQPADEAQKIGGGVKRRHPKQRQAGINPIDGKKQEESQQYGLFQARWKAAAARFRVKGDQGDQHAQKSPAAASAQGKNLAAQAVRVAVKLMADRVTDCMKLALQLRRGEDKPEADYSEQNENQHQVQPSFFGVVFCGRHA